jgi:hypothetical protein
MAYGTDYRKAAIEFKQNGNTFAQLKKVFKITSRTHYQWAAPRNNRITTIQKRKQTTKKNRPRKTKTSNKGKT